MIQRIHDSGEVAKTYRYDAFGNEETPEPLDANPFRYCGEYFDAETATLYLRARSYDAKTGRFTQEDSAKDGGNWYAYCANNPIKMVDSSGKTPKNAQEWARNEVFGKPLRETQRRIDEWQYEYMQDLPDLQTVGDAIVDGATLVNDIGQLINIDSVLSLAKSGYIKGGIGVGLAGKATTPMAELSIGYKVDIWAIEWTPESFKKLAVSETSANGSILKVINIGKSNSQKREGWYDALLDAPFAEWLNDDQWEAVPDDGGFDWNLSVGAGAYAMLGGSFEVGFDMKKWWANMGDAVNEKLQKYKRSHVKRGK